MGQNLCDMVAKIHYKNNEPNLQFSNIYSLKKGKIQVKAKFQIFKKGAINWDERNQRRSNIF